MNKLQGDLHDIIEKATSLSLWIPILVIACFFLFVVRKNGGYKIANFSEFKHRSYALCRFLSIVYFALYLVWGMFILPINYLAASAAMIRSLLYIFAAIIIVYFLHKIIFSSKMSIYAFAIVNTIFLVLFIMKHQGSFDGLY